MSWFTNFEKSIAGKLHKAFTSAKDLADEAGNEVERAEAALAAAKEKAAALSAEAHAAALAAVEKAKAETEALIAAAEDAAKKAEYHAAQVPQPVAPTLDPVVVAVPQPVAPTLDPVVVAVEPAPVADVPAEPVVTVVNDSVTITPQTPAQ